MAQPFIILGAGDFAQVAAYYLKKAGHKVEVFVVDDARYKTAPQIDGTNVVVAPMEEIHRHFPPRMFNAVVAIGYSKLNANRVKKAEHLAALGYDLPAVVDMDCRNYGTIGRGAHVFENSSIQPFTEIGDYCVLWSSNHVGHHSKIGRGTFVTSHVVISGRVTIGERCFLGVNSTITDGVTIGNRCIVQAGCVVDKDLPDDSVFTREGLSKVPSNRVRL